MTEEPVYMAPPVLLVALLSVACAGCAIEPYAGGSPAKLPRQQSAVYHVTRCTLTGTGKVVRLAHPVWYHVGSDSAGPIVFERSHDNRVVVFTNRWTDRRGYHFLLWVYGGPYGYEILLPWDKSTPALRRIWRRRHVKRLDDVWKPAPGAKPHAVCELVRGAEPRPEKRPHRAAPAAKKLPPHRR